MSVCARPRHDFRTSVGGRDNRLQALEPESGEEESDAEVPASELTGRQSLKRNFLAKVMGPIADYAGDRELLQFVFDLSTWSDIGGKKGALRGMPMWQAMKGAAWALDMQAQCDFPVAFVTWAGGPGRGGPKQAWVGI